MLASFVDAEMESFKLVLKQIKNNTLSDDFSAVVIYGGCNSGKSTLAEVIAELAPSCGHAPVMFYDGNKYGPSFDMMLECIMKDVVIVNTEAVSYTHLTLPTTPYV